MLNDIYFVSNSSSSWWLITSNHDNLDTGGSAFVDREVDVRPGSPKGQRSIYLGSGVLTADVYDRETLGREQTLQGPCIIEERETTILILPNWRATVASDGAVVSERIGAS